MCILTPKRTITSSVSQALRENMAVFWRLALEAHQMLFEMRVPYYTLCAPLNMNTREDTYSPAGRSRPFTFTDAQTTLLGTHWCVVVSAQATDPMATCIMAGWRHVRWVPG